LICENKEPKIKEIVMAKLIKEEAVDGKNKLLIRQI